MYIAGISSSYSRKKRLVVAPRTYACETERMILLKDLKNFSSI